MNTNQNKSFLQGQPGVSYYIQPTTPTDTQTLIVSQPASQSAQTVQDSHSPQSPQSDSDHVTVPIPKNGHHGRRHSSHREKLPYSHRYIPEEVSDYISQDQSGEIHLSADLNKMFGLGRCLCVLAILELFGYGFQAIMKFIAMNLTSALYSAVYVAFPIIFINGYMKLDVKKVLSYFVWRVIVIIIAIVILILDISIYNNSSPKEKDALFIYLVIYGVQVVFDV